MVSLHYIYNYLQKYSITKKIRYVGQFQNSKYQEILEELRNREIKEFKEIRETKDINIKDKNTDRIDDDDDFISFNEKEEMQRSLLNLVQFSI